MDFVLIKNGISYHVVDQAKLLFCSQFKHHFDFT